MKKTNEEYYEEYLKNNNHPADYNMFMDLFGLGNLFKKTKKMSFYEFSEWLEDCY